MKVISTVLLISIVNLGYAGDVQIRKVLLQERAGSWTAQVTLQHADTGWEHYADGWRLVAPDGTVLGHRTLHHPHVNEQPFTRSLSGITIPPALRQIVVRAHDKVHGWSPDEIRVDLSTDSGERYQIVRE